MTDSVMGYGKQGKHAMNTSSSHTVSSPAGAAPAPPTWLFVLLAAGVLVWPILASPFLGRPTMADRGHARGAWSGQFSLSACRTRGMAGLFPLLRRLLGGAHAILD